jgi:hypothetical protein
MADTERSPEILALVERSYELVAAIRPILHGQPPDAIGATLVDLLATFIAGHDPAIRWVQLSIFMDSVRKVVPVEVDSMIKRGFVGEHWRGGEDKLDG